MKIVIINSGSSSKIPINQHAGEWSYLFGMIDRIGLETSNLTYVTATTIEETCLCQP
jgi:acetate kinase